MRKLIVIVLLFAACKQNHDGTYVSHFKSDYAIVDDTLIVKDSVIMNHSCYQRIRNGVAQPKEYKRKQLFELHPKFNNHQLILNNATYERL